MRKLLILTLILIFGMAQKVAWSGDDNLLALDLPVEKKQGPAQENEASETKEVKGKAAPIVSEEVPQQDREFDKDLKKIKAFREFINEKRHTIELICAYAKKNDLTYQRIGYDGTILNVSRAFPLSFKEAEEQQGYTFTPSWVVPAVIAAAAGVASVMYKRLSLMEDLGKLHIQHSSFVPEKILDEAKQEREDYINDNIDDYLPDGYGYCDDCSHCDDCNRVDPGDHCSECDEGGVLAKCYFSPSADSPIKLVDKN